MVKKQIGSGYTFNQSDSMGGQMARVGYSDCDTPAYYNKFQVYDVPEPTQSAQMGGGRRKKVSRKSSKKTMKKSMKKSMKKLKKSKKSMKKK